MEKNGWNLRLVKHADRKPRRVWYGVHEVFYNDSGKPWLMTEKSVRLDGESAQDVLAYLKMVQHDLKRLPILDAQKIRWGKAPKGAHERGSKAFHSVKELLADLRS